MAGRVVVIGAALLLGACDLWQGAPGNQPLGPDFQVNRSTPAEAVGVQPGRMFETTQNWPDAVRRAFWHIDQGSLATPYDLALAVERVGDEALFLSPENVARYRYVPQNGSIGNRDGLPLGFSESVSALDGKTYLGMTCSACHSTVITYKGTGLLIDGAPSQSDFQSFWTDFTSAFRANLDDPAKFDRLAGRLTDGSAAAKSALAQRLAAAVARMEKREALNATESRYGNGRVDAIGQIYNSVSVQNVGIEANRGDPNAPVSFPFLWGTHQSNVVQWNGFAPNAPKDADIRIAGPLIRNAGEVLGVFGEVDIKAASRSRSATYPNSVRIENLLKVEDWLERLKPPAWPADLFGDIDPELAAKGRAVYTDPRRGNCAGCHQVLPDPLTCYNAVMVPLGKVGTDPGQATNSLRTGKTGPLAGRYALLAPPVGKVRLKKEEPIIGMLKHEIARALLHDIEARKFRSIAVGIAALKQERGEDKCEVTPTEVSEDLLQYKARPLNGIWATAPYLHNGSVPTLADLLNAPGERPATFTLGGWEYDPEAVGYAAYDGEGAFTFDTSATGNSNGGHVWGTDLDAADKEALLEYLKTL